MATEEFGPEVIGDQGEGTNSYEVNPIRNNQISCSNVRMSLHSGFFLLLSLFKSKEESENKEIEEFDKSQQNRGPIKELFTRGVGQREFCLKKLVSKGLDRRRSWLWSE